MVDAVAERPEKLETASRQVLRRRIEERAVVSERDVVEEHPVVVRVEGSPTAVRSLHAQEPEESPIDRAMLALRVYPLDLHQRHDHHSRVVQVRIEVVA